MKTFKYIILLIILHSYACENDKKERETDITSAPADNLSEENEILATTKLFLDYNSNISVSKFWEITDTLIAKTIVEKSNDGGRNVLYYMFPYCENSIGRISGENFDRFEIHPVFINDSLKSIKISGIENGASVNINKKWVPCIYKSLMETYSFDFIYDGDYYIEHSSVAVNNDAYDPIYKIQTNKISNQNNHSYPPPTAPNFIDIPDYLNDRTQRLMPGEQKTMYRHDSKIPQEIDPIVIEQEDKIIIIYHKWAYDLTTSYSLMETSTYHNLDVILRFNNFDTFIRNSKLMYYKGSYNLNIILEYTTREEYLKRDSDPTEDIRDENVSLRDISNEL